MEMIVCEIWSILVSSIVMVILECFSSLSNEAGADLFGVSLGGMNLTWHVAA
jgi:Zn-dependent protease with chaperone function